MAKPGIPDFLQVVIAEETPAGDRRDPGVRESHHLVLLASSDEGYRNLTHVVSQGWVDGLVHGVPRLSGATVMATAFFDDLLDLSFVF